MQARMVSVALLVVVALLGATASRAVAATERYTDSDYDWSIEWDDRDWEEPQEPIGGLPAGDLTLERIDGASFVLFRALDDYDGDPEECLDDVPDFLSSGFPSASGEIDYEPIEDEDGEPIAEEDDGRSYVAVTFDFGGDDTAVGFDCRTLVEDEAVLLIIHITNLRDFEDERAEVDALLEALELPGGRSTGGGGETETYESPLYGYSLEFDTNDWVVSNEDNDPDDAYDRVQLEHELGFVSLVGDPDYRPSQVDDCVEDYLIGLEQGDGVDNVRAMRGEDGEDDDRAWAAFSYELDSGSDDPFELARYIECRHLGNVTVVILQTSLEVDYDDMSDVRETLLDGLQAPDAEEESPNDDDPPASEDEDEDEDDEQLG